MCGGFFRSMAWAARTSNTTAGLRARSSARGTASSTWLVPVDFGDYDDNGMVRTTMLPMQESGTGTLTNAAQIASISLVSNGGAALRVLKGNVDAEFTSGDLLVDPNDSWAITGQQSFTGSQVRGIPKFLHPPRLEGASVDARVDISWTCGTAGVVTTPAQGYSARASALGCSGLQKFTIRPGADWIALEMYGTSAYQMVTARSANGSFSLSGHGLAAAGRILSESSNGLSVRFDDISYNGVAACQTGTYLLAPEN